MDRYVAEVETARTAWSAELARLRKVEPLTRMGDDIAELLTSFATAVLTLRSRLTEEAERIRLEAEEYAGRRVAEADHTLETARRQAREIAAEIISEAKAELAVLADQQLTIADALERAAQGIAASREALLKIQHTHSGPPAPVAPAQHSEPLNANGDRRWRPDATRSIGTDGALERFRNS